MNKFDIPILVVTQGDLLKGRDFLGLKTVELAEYFEIIQEKYQFVRRGDAEEDPYYQQIIPYIVILSQDENKILLQKRSKKGTDRRLRSLVSIGFGGHVDRIDEDATIYDILFNNMSRELSEEIGLQVSSLDEFELKGLINLDFDFHQDHFGLVYFLKIDEKNFLIQKSDEAEEIEWEEVEKLKRQVESESIFLEGWSELIMKEWKQLFG